MTLLGSGLCEVCDQPFNASDKVVRVSQVDPHILNIAHATGEYFHLYHLLPNPE